MTTLSFSVFCGKSYDSVENGTSNFSVHDEQA